MQIVNRSDKPFEFTHDSMHVVMQPGVIMDVEPHVAHLAIKQSQVLDTTFGDKDGQGEGNLLGFRVEAVSAIPKDDLLKMMRFTCPVAQAGHCDAQPFKSMDELRTHLDKHLNEYGTGPDFDLESAPVPAPPKRK